MLIARFKSGSDAAEGHRFEQVRPYVFNDTLHVIIPHLGTRPEFVTKEYNP